MDCGACRWKGNAVVCKACEKEGVRIEYRRTKVAPFETESGASLSSSHVERPSRHAPVEKEKGAGLDSFGGHPVRIVIHSRRHRLCDADGISGKAAIDGLVHRGLLKDDSPEFVKEVGFTQEKAGDEETIITIEEVVND
jgi:hypothetical protein